MLPFRCVLSTFLALCLVFGQEVLTNDSVLKLSKAGMSEEVIVGMITSQLGKYDVTADALISLKQAGVSDKVIAAMVNRPSSARSALAAGETQPMILHDGTPIRLRLSRNLSSADATTGDNIDFEVLDDVKVGDLVVVARGARAIGTITEAEHKRRMARGGKLDVTIDYVRLVDDD